MRYLTVYFKTSFALEDDSARPWARSRQCSLHAEGRLGQAGMDKSGKCIKCLPDLRYFLTRRGHRDINTPQVEGHLDLIWIFWLWHPPGGLPLFGTCMLSTLPSTDHAFPIEHSGQLPEGQMLRDEGQRRKQKLRQVM